MIRTRLAAGLAAGAVAMGAGCAVPGPPGEPLVAVLGSATSGEPAAALPSAVLAALEATATDRRWERDPAAGIALVATADDTAPRTYPLIPRRADGSVERGLQRGRIVDDNVAAVAAAVAGLAARDGRLDLLDGIARITRAAPGGLLVVLSSGLSTAGGLDLREVGWDADPGAVATELRDRGLLPDLAGWQVVFAALGATAGAQVPLDGSSYRTLVSYWMAICIAAGADRCTVDESPAGETAPLSRAPVSPVPVPGVESITGPDGAVTTSVTADLLGFAGDSAVISPAGLQLLESLATRIRSGASDPQVTVRGFAADPPGSTPDGIAAVAANRAQAVVDALAAAGLRAEPLGGELAPGPSAVTDGRFDEERAAQMRRVEITYQGRGET